MKITKKGIRRDRGERPVLENNITICSGDPGWQNAQKSLKFGLRGTHRFDVEISGEEILLMLEHALLKNADSNVHARGQAMAMLAYIRVVLAIPVQETD